MKSLNKNNYFLSVYMEIPDITGLAVMRHDHCAALWSVTGNHTSLVRYWEFERFTGLKHHRIPLLSTYKAREFLNKLLAEENLCLDDMTAIWGTPYLETDSNYKRLVDSNSTVHSISHLYSALGMNFNLVQSKQILGLALDAGSDVQLETRAPTNIYSGCVVLNGTITTFPIESPAVIWLRARGRFAREEGTLMALGSATDCQVETNVVKLIQKQSYFTQHETFANAEVILNNVIEQIQFALATKAGRLEAKFDDRFSYEDNLQSAVIKEIEKASWEIIDRNIVKIIKEFNLKQSDTYLAIAGGFALNCPNNSRIMSKFGFKEMLAPPCVNDGGQALGIGVLALAERGLAINIPPLRHAYFGRQISRLDEAIDTFQESIHSIENMDVDRAVEDLINNPIAWVQGKSEMGPRALGHRSILCDPRYIATKNQLNSLKNREWWRPVAPIVLEEEIGQWFINGHRSPFMLETLSAKKHLRHLIPAVLHLDNTARIQTIAYEDETELYGLISSFYKATGIPIIGNTSLNDKAEPLVDDAVQALNFCIRKGVSVAYIDGKRIQLNTRSNYIKPNKPAKREDESFRQTVKNWSEIWREWSNSTDLGAISLFVLAWNPRLRDTVDWRTKHGQRALKIATSNALKNINDQERSYLEILVEAFGPNSDPWNASIKAKFVGGEK